MQKNEELVDMKSFYKINKNELVNNKYYLYGIIIIMCLECWWESEKRKRKEREKKLLLSMFVSRENIFLNIWRGKEWTREGVFWYKFVIGVGKERRWKKKKRKKTFGGVCCYYCENMVKEGSIIRKKSSLKFVGIFFIIEWFDFFFLSFFLLVSLNKVVSFRNNS